MPARLNSTAPRVRLWYRDAVSCLQSTLATLLLDAGEDPLEVIGASWEFRYLPGDVRPEEFYWPCRFPGDLARSMLPHHAATSSWRMLPGDDPLAPLEAALAAGRLPIVAVDNFHLPFRPAYHDVHAAHLVVVYDVAAGAGLVQVSDAQPPAYQGPLAIDDLLRSTGSANPRGDTDVFFSGVEVGGRWLDVRLSTPFPELQPGRLASILRTNLAGFTGTDGPGSTGTDRPGSTGTDGPGWTGIVGLRRFCAFVQESADAMRPGPLGEVYPYGWGAQAQAALHGELLRRCGARWRLPALSEAGRRVEYVAHQWTAVRTACAYEYTDRSAGPRQISRHTERLAQAYDEALAAVAQAIGAL